MDLNESLLLINDKVRSLKQYHLEPEVTSIKLNQNENPFDWPIEIKQEIADFCVFRPWNRYPNFVPELLQEKLSCYTKVPQNGILVGNGSNEMLLVLLLSLANKTGNVIICQPTFSIYRLLATGLGATERQVDLNNDMTFNVPAIINCSRQFPGAVLILCSPNNPTGSTLTGPDLKNILAVHSGFCILDQAYVEFGGYNAIELLNDNPNLIITRTFSKAFGGAGLRFGYMLGNPDIISQINKIKLPYNINFFSEQVAQTLLSHTSIVEKQVAYLTQQREDLFGFLNTLPLRNVYASSANFIMFRCNAKQALFDHCKQKGILIRDVSTYPQCENCLRVNVGTEIENAAFKEALRSFFV